jgi:hypothetical protein
MIEPIDEISWTMDFFENSINLNNDGIERIKNFVFLWNIFETFACNKNAEINSIKNIVEIIDSYERISLETYSEYVNYFSNRYYNPNGDKTHNIEGLCFRPESKNDLQAKNEVISVLTGEQIEPKESLKALLIIIYRFRNNLFHGNKQIVHIDTQIDNFICANNILITVLTIMKRNNLIN